MRGHFNCISILFIAVTILCGCGRGSGSSENSADTWVFDLTKPLPASESSSGGQFDTTVFHPMNYSISQTDSRLGQVGGEFCFPTALAETFMFLFHYREPQAFPKLQLAGVSQDDRSANPVPLVDSLATACGTIAHHGTDPHDGAACIQTLVEQSGYHLKGNILITPFPPMPGGSNVLWDNRPATVDDLKLAIQNGEAVLISIGRYIYHPGMVDNGGPINLNHPIYYTSTGGFERVTGHTFGVYGFDSKQAWRDSQVSLRILNPLTRFNNDGNHILYESVMATAVDTNGTIAYPDWIKVAISGPGFSSAQSILVEDVIHFLPE